jgi:hypothetical protein
MLGENRKLPRCLGLSPELGTLSPLNYNTKVNFGVSSYVNTSNLVGPFLVFGQEQVK